MSWNSKTRKQDVFPKNDVTSNRTDFGYVQPELFVIFCIQKEGLPRSFFFPGKYIKYSGSGVSTIWSSMKISFTSLYNPGISIGLYTSYLPSWGFMNFFEDVG